MDCLKARNMIRAGVIPGAGEYRDPQLGFHLASCPGCREFRRIGGSHRAAGQVTRQTCRRPRRRAKTRRILSHLARATALLLVVCLLGIGWYLGVPLVHAWADVSTMTSLAVTRPELPVERLVRLKEAAVMPVVVPKAVKQSWESMTLSLQTLRPVPIAITPPADASKDMLLLAPPVHMSTNMTATTTTVPVTPSIEQTGEITAPLDLLATPPISAVVDVAPQAGDTAVPPLETSLPALIEEASAGAIADASVPEVPEEQVAHTDAITILVLGIDARPGEVLARSDVIMLVRLDPQRQQVTLLSLPRDLWVPIPGFGEGKIDSAYFLGEQYGEGAIVATQTVSQALNINIDRTAVVDFDGFRGLIDALGGIRVDVPRELYDPHFPTEDYGYTVAHFLPGEQMMDGARALMYSRIRHPDSDFERMRRQQAVVVGIAERLRERGVLKNLHEADQITTALRPYIRTDLPRPLALNLLWSMRSVDISSVKRVTADTSLLTETSVYGAYALMAEPTVMHELGAQLVAAP